MDAQNMNEPVTGKKSDNFKRFRFSVPNADESVLEWINAQANLSYSLRYIIKESISKNGISDATCGRVEKDRRGRPTKAQQEAMQRAENGEFDTDADMSERAIQTVQQSYPQSPVVNQPVQTVQQPVQSHNPMDSIMGGTNTVSQQRPSALEDLM